jgi:hypothetical protein
MPESNSRSGSAVAWLPRSGSALRPMRMRNTGRPCTAAHMASLAKKVYCKQIRCSLMFKNGFNKEKTTFQNHSRKNRQSFVNFFDDCTILSPLLYLQYVYRKNQGTILYNLSVYKIFVLVPKRRTYVSPSFR